MLMHGLLRCPPPSRPTSPMDAVAPQLHTIGEMGQLREEELEKPSPPSRTSTAHIAAAPAAAAALTCGRVFGSRAV